MQKKTIAITSSVAIINALSVMLLPISNQKILSEIFYLKTIKETINVCLS